MLLLFAILLRLFGLCVLAVELQLRLAGCGSSRPPLSAEFSLQFIAVIFRLLAGGSKISERCFQVRMPQEVLDRTGIHSGPMQATGKGLPPFVKTPRAANGIVFARDLLFAAPRRAMPAVHFCSESEFLQVSEEMPIGLAVFIREN